jgi:hypothetical protein
MSVIDVTKMWSKGGGSFSSEKYDSFFNKYSITEGYQVLTEPGTDIVLVRDAVGIPRPGDRHSSGEAAFVNSVQPQQISPIFYVVTVGYEGDNPFTGEVDVEWTDAGSSEPIDRDFDGRAIVTAVGEQVEGLSYDLADTVCVIRRKFVTVNLPSIAQYRHAVNSDTFLGWAPGTAKLVGYSARNKFKFGTGQELWDVTARIQFRRGLMGATDEKAWYKRWRHEGIYINASPTPDVNVLWQRARDPQGQEVTKPVLLKANGTQEYDPDNAHWFYTKLYDSLPYSALGLV